MFNSHETTMLGRSGKGQVWDDLGRMTARDTRSMKRSDDRAWKKQVRMMRGQR